MILNHVHYSTVIVNEGSFLIQINSYLFKIIFDKSISMIMKDKSLIIFHLQSALKVFDFVLNKESLDYCHC